MGHQQAYLAAAVGKRRGSKKQGRSAGALAAFKGLIFGAAALFMALFAASVSTSTASYAQSGPFTGMAGFWSGGGTVTLDDGSTERIRCRASYAVGEGGRGLNQTLTCASDSYKFDLKTNIVAQGGTISGVWSESSRNINGSIEGRGSNGNFQVVASAAGFNANISLTTRGNRQSVVIRAESQFRGATISLTRS
ncbi:hypothetical protein [Bradyrhizobium sp. dw_78]|uniref:hypothetical protein n=1 Tax=Bradyrhizobium sp. dw_78 TaxID=2719793 RepID=UPI001BD61F7D|nr:hypothetical protein [Bradyrhizobium sp. dw_78]